jgi:FtsP/CotA-like multicopper oxidase with cupredoxin domain
VPGTTIRVRRGEEVRVRLVNELPEPTVIHWHGVRLPNAMDGVPHLTQQPVEPGAQFDYRFVAPDAGTFWYHSHLYSSEQLERGLYGALIVDEPEPVEIDRDILLMLDDWRLANDGSLHTASFRSIHDAAHAGRLGRLLTINSQASLDIPVRTNERIRLRCVNAANARVIPLRVDRHAARVMAVDGQPAQPFLLDHARVTLGPGARVDLFIDMTLEPGSTASILAHNLNDEVPIGRFVYRADEGARAIPLPDPEPLPANPLPQRIDLTSALRVDAPLDGGAMSAMMMRHMRGQRGEIEGYGIDSAARIWTLAGFASSGHHGPPLFTVKRGRAVTIAFPNNTAFPHAMHVHGHHFRLLDKLDDGWKPYWLDTVLVNPKETARIAFIADNPGKWMIHCHMVEHMETGMAAWFEVT